MDIITQESARQNETVAHLCSTGLKLLVLYSSHPVHRDSIRRRKMKGMGRRGQDRMYEWYIGNVIPAQAGIQVIIDL
jgi:hypothetical protein